MLLWLSFCLSVFYFSLIDCFLFIIFFPQVPPPFLLLYPLLLHHNPLCNITRFFFVLPLYM